MEMKRAIADAMLSSRLEQMGAKHRPEAEAMSAGFLHRAREVAAERIAAAESVEAGLRLLLAQADGAERASMGSPPPRRPGENRKQYRARVYG